MKSLFKNPQQRRVYHPPRPSIPESNRSYKEFFLKLGQNLTFSNFRLQFQSDPLELQNASFLHFPSRQPSNLRIWLSYYLPIFTSPGILPSSFTHLSESLVSRSFTVLTTVVCDDKRAIGTCRLNHSLRDTSRRKDKGFLYLWLQTARTAN